MTENELRWLESLTSVDAKSVIDCDPATMLVTMRVNGEVVRRRVCERYTRVMGYHRPVHTFNPGKQSEHADRVPFIE